MRILFLSILALVTFLPGLRAELPPSVYEAMQEKAPEHLKIQVLRVDISPGKEEASQKIEAVVRVTEVFRTSTNLRPGLMIRILYTVRHHPPGWVGPREPPILNQGDETVAYLAKIENSADYEPAARAMSFHDF